MQISRIVRGEKHVQISATFDVLRSGSQAGEGRPADRTDQLQRGDARNRLPPGQNRRIGFSILGHRLASPQACITCRIDRGIETVDIDYKHFADVIDGVHNAIQNR